MPTDHRPVTFQPPGWAFVQSHPGMGSRAVLYLERGADGMALLRTLFERGADEMNVCLFSTSGVHGSYATIEEVEQAVLADLRDEDDPTRPSGRRELTFCVVQPRIVALRYGNVRPETPDDFAFLRKLRADSQRILSTLGNG